MKTVLVADDEVSIRKLYQRELKLEGYNVVFASNAQEAVQKAREDAPDLVIMDIRMPGMDGIEAMGRILEENNEIPVVIDTAILLLQGQLHELVRGCLRDEVLGSHRAQGNGKRILRVEESSGVEPGPAPRE